MLARPCIGKVWGKLTRIEGVAEDGLAFETSDLKEGRWQRGWFGDWEFERGIALAAACPNVRDHRPGRKDRRHRGHDPTETTTSDEP